MRSPVLAIAWEIWRKNRIVNWCILALLPVSVALFEGLAAWSPDVRTWQNGASPAWPLFLFPMLASLVWVLQAFTHTESDPKRGFSGMPARLFTLPVRTSFLVACLATLGILFVVLTYLVWAGVIQVVTGFALPLRWPVLSLAATVVCFQAAVWGLASFPWIRILVITAGALGVIALNVALIEAGLNRDERETALSLLLLVCLPLAGISAWLGVKAERCGGWRPWDWLFPILRAMLDALPRRTRPFATPAQAQFWFEWRRRGFFLAGGLALSIAGAAVIFPIVAMMDSVTGLPVRAVASAMLYPLLLAGLAGLGLARSEFWNKDTRLHPFQAVRPIGNAGLFIAKLKVAGGVMLLGWLLSLPMVYAVLTWSKWRELWGLDAVGARLRQWLPGDPLAAGAIVALAAICLVAAAWRTMTTALCLGLTGNRRTITIKSIVGCGLFLFVVIGGGWLSRRAVLLEQVQSGLIMLLALAAAMKLIATIRSFAIAARHQLLSPRMLTALTSIWLATATVLGAFAAVLWTETALPKPLILLALVWLWPAGELFQGVVNLAGNRHR
jgi:hypothetical protein